MWYLEEPPLSPTPECVASPNWSNPSPAMTAPSTKSTADGLFQDWREPIRQGLNSPHADIRIRAWPTNNPSPGPPASRSTTPSDGSNCRDGVSLSISRIPPHSSVHITHRSTRHTLASQPSQLSKVFPRSTASPLQATPPVPPPQQSPIVPLPSEDQATPTPALAIPLTPASGDVSQKPEPQGCTLTGDVFLQKPDVRGSIHLTLAVTSLPKEGSPHLLSIGGEEAKGRRNNLVKADMRGSEQKGAAGLGPCLDSVPALSLKQGLVGRLQKTAAWQFWSQLSDQAFQK
jgi:hypothetical protein